MPIVFSHSVQVQIIVVNLSLWIRTKSQTYTSFKTCGMRRKMNNSILQQLAYEERSRNEIDDRARKLSEERKEMEAERRRSHSSFDSWKKWLETLGLLFDSIMITLNKKIQKYDFFQTGRREKTPGGTQAWGDKENWRGEIKVSHNLDALSEVKLWVDRTLLRFSEIILFLISHFLNKCKAMEKKINDWTITNVIFRLEEQRRILTHEKNVNEAEKKRIEEEIREGERRRKEAEELRRREEEIREEELKVSLP